MTKLNMLWRLTLLCVAIISAQSPVTAQCSFSGLDETYCESDEPSTLEGDPSGGIFSGPGIVGDQFDPSIAGPGIHTVTYVFPDEPLGDKFYIRAMGGEPWFDPANAEAMDVAFGAGGWTLEEFETADAAAIFVATTGFVFLDGSSMQATELNTFLIANLPLIEDWVDDGGRLLLNSAPNEGGDYSFGFDGTLLNYAPPGSGTHINNATVIDPAYPALIGPETPTALDMTGTYYGHALITGTGLTTVMIETGDPSKVLMAEKCWGDGKVVFSGMTTHNFHSPMLEAANWRANLYTHVFSSPCGIVGGGACTVSMEVEVYPTPDVELTIDNVEICEEDEITCTATGAESYEFNIPGVVNEVAYTPSMTGLTTYIVTGTNISTGCSAVDSVEVMVNPLPVVTASTDDAEVCFGDFMTLTGGGAATYVWDTPGVEDGVAFAPGPIGTNTYMVTGTDAEGCVSTASVTISIIDCEPVFAGFEFDNNICVGDCITLTDTSIGTTIQTWDWSFGGGADPDVAVIPSPTVCFETVGVYNLSLTITSLYGQVSTATHTLTVNALPVVVAEQDTIITLAGTADLIATSTSTGDYTWSPDDNHIDCIDCPITYTSPLDSTMYTVLIVDENGCVDEDNVMVLVNFVKGVGLPTAFSPNGDGNNDVLYVKGRGLASVNLVVYNRYGEIVFESSDQSIGWDGTFKNKDENPGVFTWVLQYNFINGDTGKQNGNVTLIR